MRTITITGPGKNALGSDLMMSLLEQVQSAAAAGEPLLLTGDGDAFSAGLNLKEVHSLDVASMRRFHRVLEDLVGALYDYPAPTAAAINGHAIAGGMILGLVCDFRYVTHNSRARLGLNEVALGLRFPPRLLKTVRACIPSQNHNEVLLGARLHSPVEALRIGLVDGVSEDPVARATEVLSGLATHPDGAYAAAKAMIRPPITTTAEEDAHFESHVLPVWVSDDVKSRIAGFLKR